MLNRYPIWKNLLILAILGFAGFYAAPNLYAPDPAVQISGENSSQVLDRVILDRIKNWLALHF